MLDLLFYTDYSTTFGHEPFVLYNLAYSIYMDRPILQKKNTSPLIFKISGLIDYLNPFLIPIAASALYSNLNLIFFNLGLLLEPVTQNLNPLVLNSEKLKDI